MGTENRMSNPVAVLKPDYSHVVILYRDTAGGSVVGTVDF